MALAYFADAVEPFGYMEKPTYRIVKAFGSVFDERFEKNQMACGNPFDLFSDDSQFNFRKVNKGIRFVSKNFSVCL